MLAMGPRDLNSAPYSPVHCSSHSMATFQSSELTELPMVENSQLFAQRAHSTQYAPPIPPPRPTNAIITPGQHMNMHVQTFPGTCSPLTPACSCIQCASSWDSNGSLAPAMPWSNDYGAGFPHSAPLSKQSCWKRFSAFSRSSPKNHPFHICNRHRLGSAASAAEMLFVGKIAISWPSLGRYICWATTKRSC